MPLSPAAKKPKPWRPAYNRCLKNDDDSADFHVLSAPAATDQPLLIWIHPGDAVEAEDAFDRPELSGHQVDEDEDEFEDDIEDEYQNSLDFQNKMASEIYDKAATHQVIILHRQSDDWAFTRGYATHDYKQAMIDVEDLPSTVHLYGDDLKAASAWIIENMNTPTRPDIFMTGAYSDPKDGCMAFVGQEIEKSGVINMQATWSSPSSPGSSASGWHPKKKPVPEETPAPKETPAPQRSPMRPR